MYRIPLKLDLSELADITHLRYKGDTMTYIIYEKCNIIIKKLESSRNALYYTTHAL